MTLQLRPYQRAAIDAIYDYFTVETGHPLVVIPTAGGKSLVMAAFIQEVLAQWPDERIIILTHVRELISQNFAELIRLWPEAPAGHLQRRAEPARRPGADPVRRHPVGAQEGLRHPACRPGAGR